MSDGISHDEHVQQNNQRLVSVKNSLVDQSTFETACGELTHWCSDHRAFNTCFEDNLLAALQVAVENGTKDGYNFPLAHTLISTCFTHRKRLSKTGANRIGRWYEQFRRLKKSGGKKGKGGKKTETSTVAVIPLAMDTEVTVTESGNMWNAGPHIAGPSPMQSPGYPQQGIMPQQMNGYGMPNGQYPVPGGPMDPNGHRPYMNEYEQQQMMNQHRMMMMHQQQQMQAQAHAQAQAQAQAQAAAAPAPAPRRRGRQNTAAAAAAAAQAQAQAQQQAAPPGYDGMYQQVPMGANMVPGQVQPLMRVPSQPGMLSPAYPGNPMQQRPGMPMTSPAYPQGAHPQMIRAGPPVMFGQIAQNPQQQRVYSMPNTGHPGGVQAQASLPANLPQYSEPTATLWMQRDMIMAPYMLPHELNTVTQEFHITEEQKISLRNSSNYDVILKAFVKEDIKQSTQWPKSQTSQDINISITLNDWLVPINIINRSVMVKDFINVGTNTVKFMAAECVCRHLFMMYFAEKTTVPAISHQIMQTVAQRTNGEMCKQKLVQFASRTGGCLRVPLFCQSARKRLSIPARTVRCQHPQCFDLDSLLVAQQENLKFECPFCPPEMGAARCFGLHEVEVDMFLGHVLAETSKMPQQPTEILIYANGSYQFAAQAMPMNPMNTMNPNMNNGMPMNPMNPTDPANNCRPNSRKRPMDDGVPMKRIKSEPMSVHNQLIGPPTSVPGALPSFGQSPAGMVSPFGGNLSPNKGMASPAGARFPGGPNTPQTPGLHGYPAQSTVVKIEPQDNYQVSAPTSVASNMQNGPTAGATAPVPIGSGTSVSPHQTAGPIQQNGSVETPSLTGSAPYTPASLSNGISSTHHMVEIKHFDLNISATSITDILEMDLGNPFNTCVLSPEDFPRYLYDAENGGFDASGKHELNHDDSINDVFDLIKTNRI